MTKSHFQRKHQVVQGFLSITSGSSLRKTARDASLHLISASILLAVGLASEKNHSIVSRREHHLRERQCNQNYYQQAR